MRKGYCFQMITARTLIETAAGAFTVCHHSCDDRSCLTFSRGNLEQSGTLVRLHSSCLFGKVLGALDCDCGPQLRIALTEIDRVGAGVVVYMFQEGRGAGILIKIRGMGLQRGRYLNSYEAYDLMGVQRYLRDYYEGVVALRDLGVSCHIRLMTNNPLKVLKLEEAGYIIDELVALSYEVDKLAYGYLTMKRDIGNHTLDFSKIQFIEDAS
jgi:GTP cyclohydrolase II